MSGDCCCQVLPDDETRINPCPLHEKWMRKLLRQERERCAEIADGELMEVYDASAERVAKSIATAIRERNN